MRKALYRVYRPQFFRDVVGQTDSTTALKNAITREEFTHAYLFSGPRGTGKTTIAKIMGKAVNCTSPEQGEPCGKCHNCTSANPTDIIEIDAASNNGVDEIREIRDNVKYAPTNGRFKVYIIDEVHMLTMAAFNALLKTLEEPPSHVIFILATTEPHKVPLTIISRCQRYDFKRISIKDIVGRLKEVLAQENIKAEDHALGIIARVAQGGLRDALSLLDQSISHSEEIVTTEDVIAITGTVGLDLLTKTVELIHNKKTSEVLDVVNEIIEGGKEPHFFLEDLLTYYRDIIIFQTIGQKADLSKATLDETFISLTKMIPSPDIYSITEVLNEKLKDIKYSSNSKVLLELALVKVCQPSTGAMDTLSKEELKKELLEELQKELSKGTVAYTAATKEVVKQELAAEEKSEEKKLEQIEEKQPELEASAASFEVDSLLDEIESELKVEEVEKQEVSLEQPSDFIFPEDDLAPPTEELDFITMIQNDIEQKADYIEFVDENNPFTEKSSEPNVGEDNSGEIKDYPEQSEPEIYSILENCTKEHKSHYTSNEEMILNTLKKKKLPTFKLLDCAKKVWAVSDTHIVVEFADSLKSSMVSKKSHQSVLKETFKEVLGRELEVKAFTTDEITPILQEVKARKSSRG